LIEIKNKTHQGEYVMKKSLIFVLVAALLLTACGQAASVETEEPAVVEETTVEEAAPVEEAEAAEEVEEAAPVEKTVVQVISWWDFTSSIPLQELKAGFEAENPDLELEYIQVGKGYADKVMTMIAGGGDLPDVMMLAMDKVPFFADRGAIQNLDQFITEDYKSDLYPFVLDALTYNDSVYAVARDVTPKVMFLNVDLFEEAGIEVPGENWTWEDFRSISAELSKVDESGQPLQWGFYFPKYSDGFAHWLMQNEGGLVVADGSASAMDTPESIEAINFLRDMILEDGSVPTESQAQQFGTSGTAPFIAGKVAMFAGGLSTTVSLNDAGINYTVLPLPAGKQSLNTAFVNAWTIPTGAKNPELSWRVMEYFSTKGQQIVLDTGMGLPASISVDTSAFVEAADFNKYFISAMDSAVPFPTPLYGADYFNLIKSEFDLMWLGDISVEDAVGSVVEQGNLILSGDN
jgi:multiple sugar transport system substrate-binding protein